MKTRSGIATTAIVATLVWSGWALLSAQQTGTGQVPAFRSGVELVTVDVGVVDRQGNPLRGLGAGDFSVTVGGQPRRVVTAEYVDTAAARPAALAAVAGPDVVPVSTNEGVGVGRLFVFIVDQSTIEPGNVRQVARAASRFFGGLTFVDRSSLTLMPAGPNVPFTWAHDRVRDALQRVIGMSMQDSSWEFGSLTEARDIANRNLMTLRQVGQRQCGVTPAGIGSFGGGGGSSAPPDGAPQDGQPGRGGQTAAGGSGGGRGGSSNTWGSGSGFGTDTCSRDLQMRADSTWRAANMTSLASLASLRHELAALERVRGDKTVILVSGGWPLDDREQDSLLSATASAAAAARATIYSLFLPRSMSSASLPTASSTPVSDHHLHSWPLETLAAMTGGGSFRVEVGAEGAFERLGRETAGYYRIGVEKEPADRDGKARRMKVQVSRNGMTVRAREIFDVPTYEDRDWGARLASALDAPIPATDVHLRVTSYLAPDPDDTTRLKLVLAGEASRLDPGEAEFQLLVSNLEGKKVLAGEKPIGQPTGDGLSFSANVLLSPGSYIIRIAVIDGAGRVGSVDHRADVRPVSLGALSATGPVLIRVPTTQQAESRLAVNDVRQDERLALQIDLEGDRSRLVDADVVFEIAATNDGPSLVQTPAAVSEGSRGGWVVAQGVADLRLLPPGHYVARARIKSGTEAIGELHRAFDLTEAPRLPADAVSGLMEPANASAVAGRPSSATLAARAVSTIPPFTVEYVLAPQVLGPFLDRVAARPDASSPMIRELVEYARKTGIAQLNVSDALAAESPVASFLRGLTLLSQRKLQPAANAFRSAMRASSDFYPAMVYLGACYAAGGNDKEAAGAWRTALIKEGDALPLHVLLTDALLRQDRGDQALEALDSARSRWPADDGLKRRFVIAALRAGEYADGLQTLDELVEKRAQDEPALAAGLLALYEAFVSNRPIEDVEKDRARMTRLADAYRAHGGPSLALIETWVAAAKRSP
jgi:VWFA-related protein